MPESLIFSRVRRQIGSEVIFAFVSNPPTRPAALVRRTLDKDVEPAQIDELQRLLFMLINQAAARLLPTTTPP